MVIQSIKSVFALMTLIFTGFYFTGKPWFGKGGMDFLSKFTVEATIPFYMFYSIYRDIGTREALFSLVKKLPVTFLISLLCLAISGLAAGILKINRKRQGTFIAACGFPNVVFVGFPVIQALWGEGVTSIGVIFYSANTFLFWTIGIWLLQKGSSKTEAGGSQFFANLKKLICPPIVGMLLGMAAILLGIRVPDVVLKPLSMISGVTSPLALIFIGSVIRNMDFKTIRFGRDLYAALALRFVILPAAIICFLKVMPIPTEMKQVFFMLSTMPAMAQMGIMAREYESDYEFACTIITVTTLISMMTIPIFIFLMQRFQIF